MDRKIRSILISDSHFVTFPGVDVFMAIHSNPLIRGLNPAYLFYVAGEIWRCARQGFSPPG